MLVSDGLFIPSGLFYCMPPVDLQTLEELFREHVPDKYFQNIRYYPKRAEGPGCCSCKA
jgi:hypothetical protein